MNASIHTDGWIIKKRCEILLNDRTLKTINLRAVENVKPTRRILSQETPRNFNGAKIKLDRKTMTFENKLKPNILLKFRSGSDLHANRVKKSDKTDVNVNVKIPFKMELKFKPPTYKPKSKPKIVCSIRITVKLGILNKRL